MSNDTVPYKFLDQCLMHPPWEVAFGKFGKSPRKGGFTRYFVDQYPTAQPKFSIFDKHDLVRR